MFHIQHKTLVLRMCCQHFTFVTVLPAWHMYVIQITKAGTNDIIFFKLKIKDFIHLICKHDHIFCIYMYCSNTEKLISYRK